MRIKYVFQIIILTTLLYPSCVKKNDDNLTVVLELNETQTNFSADLTIYKKAKIAVENKQFEMGLSFYKQYLNEAPKDLKIYIEIADIYNKLGLPKRAETILLSAKEYFTGETEPHKTLAYTQYKLGKYNSSLENFYIALSNTLTNKKSLSFILTGIGKSYREMEYYNEADEYFSEALSVMNNFWTYYEYGKLYGLLKDHPLALRMYNNARTFAFTEKQKQLIVNKTASTIYAYANILRLNGDIQTARFYLRLILDDKDLAKTTYAEKAGFWIQRWR